MRGAVSEEHELRIARHEDAAAERDEVPRIIRFFEEGRLADGELLVARGVSRHDIEHLLLVLLARRHVRRLHEHMRDILFREAQQDLLEGIAVEAALLE